MKRFLNICLFISGIGLLIIAILASADIIYTTLNPHIVYAVKSFIRIILIFLFSGAIGVLLINKSTLLMKKRCLIHKLIFYYAFLVYSIILFSVLFGKGVLIRNVTYILESDNKTIWSGVNIVPFRTIYYYIRSILKRSLSSNIVMANILGNIILFVPMGFFMPYLSKRQGNINILIMMVIILIIEIMQMITDRGIFDVDDLILNMSGFLMMHILTRSEWFDKTKVKLGIKRD